MQLQDWQPRSDWGKKIYDEGRAADILVLLELRGVTVSAALRERVTTCTDRAQLDLWFHRAALGGALEETFA